MKENVELLELSEKHELLTTLPLLNFLYPELTSEGYADLLDEVMKSGRYRQLLVKFNGQPVGVSGFWIGTKIWSGKYLEIDHFVVDSAYRSKGIGEQIVRYLKEKAIAENCQMLALDAYTDNFPAHKFFMNVGFVPRGFHFIQKLK
jgi:GNAT superfamily N-acetyltransferase